MRKPLKSNVISEERFFWQRCLKAADAKKIAPSKKSDDLKELVFSKSKSKSKSKSWSVCCYSEGHGGHEGHEGHVGPQKRAKNRIIFIISTIGSEEMASPRVNDWYPEWSLSPTYFPRASGLVDGRRSGLNFTNTFIVLARVSAGGLNNRDQWSFRFRSRYSGQYCQKSPRMSAIRSYQFLFSHFSAPPFSFYR